MRFDIKARSVPQTLTTLEAIIISSGKTENVEDRNVPRIIGYNGGAARYRKIGQKAKADGFRNLTFVTDW